MAGRPSHASSIPQADTLPANEPVLATSARSEDAELLAACRRMAATLTPRLDRACLTIVRPPYVLAGDLSERALEQLYHGMILPTAHALSTCYFDRQPNEPIVILMFSNEKVYRQHARRLDHRQNAAYYGYYLKSERRIVLDISTGYGTLAHELTHALAHFDFPQMPEWLDEGLASLHEQSEFSDDGLRLIGLPNWRVFHLLYAIRRDQLQPLASLISQKSVRDNQESIDYAHARYFCLYLQQRQLLIPFYRKFRARADNDPTGLESLHILLNVESLTQIDAEFRRWAVETHGSRRP